MGEISRKDREAYREDLIETARRFPRRIVESLRSQSELLLELMDCVDDLVFILDPSLRIVQANRCATVFLGYAEGELLRKPLPAILAEAERGEVGDFIQGVRKRQSRGMRFFTRTAKALSFECSVSPLCEPDKEPHGYLLVCRRAAESSAPEREDASNGLVERMLRGFSDPLFIVDGASRTVCDCNAAAVSAFGFSREELLGRRPLDHGDFREASIDILARADAAYATSGIFQERLRFPRKSGQSLLCDCICLPVFRPEGSLAYVIMMLFDRSSEEEREMELSGLVRRVADLAAQLTAIAGSYPERPEERSLSELGFTQRQIEIASQLVRGSSSKDIGFHLGIAESTVKNHIAVMFRKLGTSSRIGFVRELAERRIKLS